jgi:hypothetical protein
MKQRRPATEPRGGQVLEDCPNDRPVGKLWPLRAKDGVWRSRHGRACAENPQCFSAGDGWQSTHHFVRHDPLSIGSRHPILISRVKTCPNTKQRPRPCCSTPCDSPARTQDVMPCTRHRVQGVAARPLARPSVLDGCDRAGLHFDHCWYCFEEGRCEDRYAPHRADTSSRSSH